MSLFEQTKICDPSFLTLGKGKGNIVFDKKATFGTSPRFLLLPRYFKVIIEIYAN